MTDQLAILDIHAFFPLFHPIYARINTPERVRHLTLGVLADFWQDGVAYLELRTTPRAAVDQGKGGGMSKEAYIRAVLGAMQEFSKSNVMASALILSLDTRHTPT